MTLNSGLFRAAEETLAKRSNRSIAWSLSELADRN